MSSTNHRQFLAALSNAQRQTLTEKSDYLGLMRLVQHWSTILVLAILVAFQVSFWPLLMLPLGMMLVFQFTLLHETTHYTPFASRRINDVVATIVGFMLFLPPTWFRCFHLEHHRHTHIPGRDPELDSPKPTNFKQYALYISGLPVWKSHLKTLLANASGRCKAAYVPAKQANRVKQEAQWMIGVYVLLLVGSVMTGSALLLYVWILPLLIGQPLLRFYLLAEHTGCPHGNDMFVNTRTTYTNGLILWLAWNMPYHAEHHSFSSVPFHRLPQLNSLIQQHLKTTAKGYIEFHGGFIKALR